VLAFAARSAKVAVHYSTGKSTIPQRRFGVPEDCAGGYLFLASPSLSGYIVGQTHRSERRTTDAVSLGQIRRLQRRSTTRNGEWPA
jgi:NAD(P)-dependent dehydrogenase (short-subunit alcohol dehydrogenase family)